MRILFLFMIIFSGVVYAEDSPFDVLNSDDRYQSEPSKEFDVNEGADESLENANTNGAGVFDVLPDIDRVEPSGSFYKIAKIVALNKITAKSKEFTVKVGDTVYFGNIAISVKKCWSNNDQYFPQNKILLSIVESKIDDDPQNIFSGWMISSNIQASVMEHPSYEVIALECVAQ